MSMKIPLWSPSPDRVAESNLTRFVKYNEKSFADYPALHEWSVNQSEEFWISVRDFCGVIGETITYGNHSDKDRPEIDQPEKVLQPKPPTMPGSRWFPEYRLNFAENLLKYQDDQVALISILENGERQQITYRQLAQKVTSLSQALKDRGIVSGDRVVAFMPNVTETVIGMLATTSLGAVWSSCSPDFGINGVLDRFGQITPKVLIAANGYYYNGKEIDSWPRVEAIVDKVDSIERVLVVDVLQKGTEQGKTSLPVESFDALTQSPVDDFNWERFPFDHPLYIMYSSGTTGIPKCIVHGAGGTLLQHLKEQQLHVDLKREDVLFYFTTCGWMMWNWLVSGLATGSTLVLYDGSPFHPDPECLLRHVEKEKISIFGTSAKYIASLEKSGVKPQQTHDLASLKTILSTGSPLTHESFQYIYRDVKEDVCLSSISGGTDIVSCFALGNAILPVYEGELQCKGLGMDVHIFNDRGESVKQEKGELVCCSPFPSMPVGFWNDDDGSKYHGAYFNQYPGVWAHGDFGEITAHEGMIIYGRSDAVLNPGGVRIGTAEIYRQVETFNEILDAICIGQDWEDDVRVVLFVVLRDGVALTDALRDQIRLKIRSETTPRHTPAKIIAVADIPRTISGKIVELAVRNIVHGQPVKNRDALANPEALEYFQNLAELKT